MDKQKELFRRAKSMMQSSNPVIESILYHNICFLKMSDKYIYDTREGVEELVNFLNRNLN